MDLAISHVPDDPARVRELAALAEACGIRYLGLADSPLLHGGVIPAVQYALARTFSLRVGTFVTNPVLRHPAALGADVAMLEQLHPGRVWVGIGAGDTSVRSVGLPAATPSQLSAAVSALGERLGGRCAVLVAVGGLRSAQAVPPEATGLILGGGLDATWISRLVTAAEAAAGHRLQRWAFAVSSLTEEGAELAAAESDVLGSVMTISRHGLGSDPASRGVPEQLVAGLNELYAGYDLADHGRIGGSNTLLMQRFPEQRDYLLGRFALVGSATSVAGRMRVLADELGEGGQLDGVFVTTGVSDPDAHIARVGRELRPLLTQLPGGPSSDGA